jgi:hypothetical protein
VLTKSVASSDARMSMLFYPTRIVSVNFAISVSDKSRTWTASNLSTVSAELLSCTMLKRTKNYFLATLLCWICFNECRKYLILVLWKKNILKICQKYTFGAFCNIFIIIM